MLLLEKYQMIKTLYFVEFQFKIDDNMGIKSTHYVSRDTAIDIIRAKIHDATNEEIAEILEGFKESYYRNYIVINGPVQENHGRRIEGLHDFDGSF